MRRHSLAYSLLVIGASKSDPSSDDDDDGDDNGGDAYDYELETAKVAGSSLDSGGCGNRTEPTSEELQAEREVGACARGTSRGSWF